MSVAATPNHAFRHRFNADDALNPEVLANKIGAIGYRTKGMLSLVIDYLVDHAGPGENNIIGTLEAAIESMNDLQEIQHFIDLKLKDVDRHAKLAMTGEPS